MVAEIKQYDRVGLLSGKQAWHGLGVVIDKAMTAYQAGVHFGMFWPVVAAQLQAVLNGQIINIDSHVANIRTQDNQGNPIEQVLGIVGSDYQICQNQELAEFVDALAQTGQVQIESCGSIRNGKRVWFLAKSDSFFVGGSKAEVVPYMLASMGHDGTMSIRLTPTSVWVVCSNTLHMVIPNRDDIHTRPDNAAISIRHSGKLHNKLAEAKRALQYYSETVKRNQEMYEAMQAKKFDRGQAIKLFADVYSANWEAATNEELSSLDAKERRLAQNRLRRMTEASKAFLQRYDAEQNTFGSQSLLSAFNAISGFIQHEKTSRGADDTARVSSRVESNLFGLNANRTHEALAHALMLAS